MFLVGGGILTHAIPELHDLIHHQVESTRQVRAFGSLLAFLASTLAELVAGLVAGLLSLPAWSGVKRLRIESASA